MALLLVALAANVACNKEPTADPKLKGETKALTQDKVDAKAKAEGKAGGRLEMLGALLPRLGGSLVPLGDHFLELAIHKNGLVEGLLFDKQGKAVLKPEATELSVALAAQGDTHPVADLKWDAQSSRFVGTASPPEASASGTAKGKTDAAVDPKLAAKADTKAGVKGAVDVKGDADAAAKLAAKAEAGAGLDSQLELVPGPIEVTAKLDGKAEKATLVDYALLSEPEFGGTLLGAGKYTTELIARPDGQLQAFVTDANGKKLEGGGHTHLKARLGARTEPVELAWNPERACFIGKLADDSRLEAGVPLGLALDAQGKTHVGGVAELPVSVAAKPEASVVIAGAFPVELATNAGFVEAHVFDASGQAHGAGDLGVTLSVGADAKKKLNLVWHAPCACYRAKLGAKLDLFAEPIRVHVVNAGRLHTGAALSLNAVENARLDVDAKLASDAKLGAEAKLNAKLPDAKAEANLKGGAKTDLKAAADAKAKVAADAKATAAATKNLNAKASVAVPEPKVKKHASASASAANGTAKASVKAGFSFSTK